MYKPAAIAVDQRDHVGGILTDELKKLISLGQLAANAVELQMLIDGVKVEEQYQSGQPAHPFPEIKPVRNVRLPTKPGKGERDDPQGQGQGYRNGEPPQPPFAAFDPAHLARNRLGAVLAHLLKCLLIHAVRPFPSGLFGF